MAGCPAGGRPQPWDAFWPATRWPDGSVRRVRSKCKACEQRISVEKRRVAERRGSGGSGGKPMDAGPFLGWLEGFPGTVAEKARATGLHHDTVGRLLSRRPGTVALDVVDRAMLNTGTPIGALYPDF